MQPNPYLTFAHIPLLGRMINIPAIIYYYIKILFFPWELLIDQSWTISKATFQYFYFPLIADSIFFVVIGIIGFYSYKKSVKLFKEVVFFFTWFILELGMLVQIFPIDLTVADRFMYFPLAGLLVVIGVGIKLLPKITGKLYQIGITFVILICIAFSIRTIIRNANWNSDFSLNYHDAALATNFDLENNLGVDYLVAGQCQNTLVHFTKSATLNPTDISFGNMGLASVCLKKPALASVDYIKSSFMLM